MRVLGIDPGSICTGWGLIVGTSHQASMVECGEIRMVSGRPLSERLHQLRYEFEEVVGKLRPEAAAVESPFHGNNAKSAFRLAHARGVLLAVLGGLDIPVSEYAPAAVKRSVTGNGRAEKGQVENMVTRLLSLERPPGSPDRADALAVALCHLACAPGVAAGLR